MRKQPAKAGDDERDVRPSLLVEVVELLAIDEIGLHKEGVTEGKEGWKIKQNCSSVRIVRAVR